MVIHIYICSLHVLYIATTGGSVVEYRDNRKHLGPRDTDAIYLSYRPLRYRTASIARISARSQPARM